RRSGRIGGEKGVDGKVREGDVNWRSENRRRADERENSLLSDEPERHNPSGVLLTGGRRSGPSIAGHWVAAELVQQFFKNRVGGDFDLAAQAPGQMGTPFPRLGGWRGQPPPMQAAANH